MTTVLSEHDLRTLKLQVHKSTFRPLISDPEAEDITPERYAPMQVKHIDFRNQASKAASG